MEEKTASYRKKCMQVAQEKKTLKAALNTVHGKSSS